MGFAEELAKRRKMANMTQEELAEKCSVSRQAVTKWERNEFEHVEDDRFAPKRDRCCGGDLLRVIDDSPQFLYICNQ